MEWAKTTARPDEKYLSFENWCVLYWWYWKTMSGRHGLSFSSRMFNLLWPSGAAWQHRSGLTLVQVTEYCLTKPSIYLTQYWFIINEFVWLVTEGNFTETVLDTTLYKVFPNYIFENTATSSRDQRFNKAQIVMTEHIYFVFIVRKIFTKRTLAISYIHSEWDRNVTWNPMMVS